MKTLFSSVHALSHIRLFVTSWTATCHESVLHIRWPKYWSFSPSISPFSDFSGLIFIRVDWFDLLTVLLLLLLLSASVVSDSVRPHGWQPTRLPVPGILQARTLEWVAISFSNS